MGTPFVKAEQDRAIRIEDLPEVVVCGSRLRLAEERLVPFEAASHIAYPYDRPRALHWGVFRRPNGLRLSGARKGVRCSRGLGQRRTCSLSIDGFIWISR